MRRSVVLLTLIWGLWIPAARAHRLSDALLRWTVTSEGLRGRLDLPIRDLALRVPLDTNGDGQVTWGELQEHFGSWRAVVQEELRLQAGGRSLDFAVEDLRVVEVAGEMCASVVLRWAGVLPPGPIRLEYRLLAEVDPLHRGLVRWERAGQVTTAVLGPEHPVAEFAGTDGNDAGGPVVVPGVGHFVGEGFRHIGEGVDHLLFLLALLLPAALPGRREREPGNLRGTLLRVAKVVTAFTVAHSLTLLLSALRVVRLPSAFVEVAIAVSVALAALNNLVPMIPDRGAWVAFGFGLIHGFGFAGVLGELDLPVDRFVVGVLGFNLGVELGQLVLVALFLPLAFPWRNTAGYRRGVVPVGSAAILAAAFAWVGERAFGWAPPW